MKKIQYNIPILLNENELNFLSKYNKTSKLFCFNRDYSIKSTKEKLAFVSLKSKGLLTKIGTKSLYDYTPVGKSFIKNCLK